MCLDTDHSGELSAEELVPAIQEFAAALGIPETGGGCLVSIGNPNP